MDFEMAIVDIFNQIKIDTLVFNNQSYDDTELIAFNKDYLVLFNICSDFHIYKIEKTQNQVGP